MSLWVLMWTHRNCGSQPFLEMLTLLGCMVSRAPVLGRGEVAKEKEPNVSFSLLPVLQAARPLAG